MLLTKIEAGLGPAHSIQRQLLWCRAYVLEEPELASLINEVERLTNIRLQTGDEGR